MLAEEIRDCILLTGDSPLRAVAEADGIEVHGVLWAIDEMEAHEAVPQRVLYDALRLFHGDNLVFLPAEELSRRMRRLSRPSQSKRQIGLSALQSQMRGEFPWR